MNAAEQYALQFLQRQGLRLVQANYRSRFGEIDLMMWDGAVLVFVEVRQRRHQNFGGAVGSIDGHKQQRLIHTAQLYLATQKRVPPCRFDAVLMEDAAGRNVQWLKNAFET